MQEVHQLRGEPGVAKVAELIRSYRDRQIRLLIASDSKRSGYIGAIRALDRVYRDILEGPRNFDKT